MAGRFEGFTDEQWAKIEGFVPKEPAKRGKGMPHAPWRKILNTLTYVAQSGCRWCDIPTGPQWGKRTTSHRWLGRWQEEGVWENLKRCLLTLAAQENQIDWNRASVDGSFSPWEGRRRTGRPRIQRKRRDAA